MEDQDEIEILLAFEIGLREGLAKAKTKFDEQRPDGGRLGAMVALQAVISSRPDLDEEMAPLRALMRALLSLHNGTVEKMLAAAQRKGGKASFPYDEFRGRVAGLSGFLMEHDWPEKAADEFVAERLSRAGYRKRRGRGDESDRKDIHITRATIRDWRRLGREGSNGIFRRSYEGNRATPVEPFPNAEARAEDMVRVLVSRMPPTKFN